MGDLIDFSLSSEMVKNTAMGDLIDFTLSNARRFYVKGGQLGRKRVLNDRFYCRQGYLFCQVDDHNLFTDDGQWFNTLN